ncbi:CapA family protein [Carboxylicivirga sediminis]|uniref:CapA family protein n=1 Tax=Carboxylicivirga sediminis TaxID=2006564 RepID=A0A941F5Z0_9BACT|nr:CapA family protein [Carboxylicivirga sediminis]MBR8537097.1 CapA family protein [Carboxylicivirga sediminis]
MRLYLFILLLLPQLSSAQERSTLSLVFMGDVMGHDSQIKSARIGNGDQFDYNSCFRYIKDDIKIADIAIANLEVTLAGPPHKGYPAFSSPDTLVDALQEAGIDALVMANNHCVDRRKKGLNRTCDILDQKGMPRTGVFKDSLDRVKHTPMIIEKNGFRIAFLNYTYGTNGIHVQPPNIVNHIDTAIIAKDIQVAMAMHVDETIVCMHWGWEYQTKPNPEQKRLANWLKSKGINIIIGSHPHVLQPMELTVHNERQSLVAYSMGNFISNQRPAPRDGSALLFVELEKKDGITKVINAEYQLTWVYTPIIGDKKHFYVMPAVRYKNAKWMQETARKRMNEYVTEAREILKYNKAVDEKKFNQPLSRLNGFQMDVPDVHPGGLVSL